jgi:hypothetical protein
MMLDDILVHDYESYFGDDWTLQRGKGQKTTEEYVRGPKFEAHCLGWKSMTTGDKGCVSQKDIPAYFDSLRGKRLAVIHHHAQFDGLISAHHYGFVPDFYFDTMVMARIVLGQRARVGLGKLCERYGLAPKSVPYLKFRNKRWGEMPKWLQTEIMDGCVDDCEATGEVFRIFLPHCPQLELEGTDMTTRLYTKPRLIGDAAELRRIHEEEVKRKAALLEELGLTKKDIGSNAKFIAILEHFGVEPEWKQGTNGLIPAFARTDTFMQDMLVCGDEVLEVLAETRLATKSSLNETRALRMAEMSERGGGACDADPGGVMPVYHNHAKTQTLRPTGGDKMNWVNLPRKGPLRGALKPPAGHKLVVVDLSAIELRVFLYEAGQLDILARIADGADIYSEEASAFHGRLITKDDPEERGTFKQVILSGQYGSGAKRIQKTLRSGGYGPRVFITDAQAEAMKKHYRTRFDKARPFWKKCEHALEFMATAAPGETYQFSAHCELSAGRITHLPTGCYMHYEHLFYQDHPVLSEDGKKVLCEEGYNLQKGENWYERIWGSKFTADYIQWLSRIIFTEKCLLLRERYGLVPCMTVYDEWVGIVDEDEAEDALLKVEKVFRASPAWAADLPLDCEGKIMEKYGK